MSAEKIDVTHNAAQSRFEATVDGRLAVADYERAGEAVVFTHTFVPAELRGRGVAEQLVRAGLAWARAGGRRVVPACSYVEAFIRRHAEFRDLA
jgi:hypothetical protein